MNLAAGAGALPLILMWTAVLPPENNPFMDDHIIYAFTLGLLASLGAGRWIGLGEPGNGRGWCRSRRSSARHWRAEALPSGTASGVRVHVKRSAGALAYLR